MRNFRVCGWIGFDKILERGEGIAPETVEIGADFFNASGVNAIDPAVADGFVENQPGIFKNAQMLGDSGPADRKVVSDLLNRGWTFG